MQAFHPSSLRSYWCCEYTSHDCWLWQRTDSHNPSQKIGPSSFSPGQARPSLHKTLIDLMDLCAVNTPFPNKQSAQDSSPLRQRGSVRLPRAKATLCNRLRGQRQSAKLVNFSLGLREGWSVLRDNSSYCKSRLPPPVLPPTPSNVHCLLIHESLHFLQDLSHQCYRRETCPAA